MQLSVSAEKKKLALIFDTASNEYAFSIYLSAVEEAKKHNSTVTALAIGNINFLKSECRDSLISLLSLIETNYDGLIVIGDLSFLPPSDDISPKEKIMAFCRKFPSVFVSAHFESMPCLNAVNEPGIRKIVNHLYHSHSCRSFLYINGDHQIYDAAERLKSFQSSVKSLKIQPEQYSFLESTFYPGFVDKILDTYTSSGKDFPDAVVCANDLIAYNTIIYFQNRGVRIPEEVIVTGFDDSKIAKDMEITTIRTPVEYLGSLAVRHFFPDNKNEISFSEETIELQLRNSCGCGKKKVDEEPKRISEEYIHINILNSMALHLRDAQSINQISGKMEFLFKLLNVTDVLLFLSDRNTMENTLLFKNGCFTKLKDSSNTGNIDIVDRIIQSHKPGEPLLVFHFLAFENNLGYFFSIPQPKRQLLLENINIHLEYRMQNIYQTMKLKKHATELEHSVSEKEILLKEVHHRVKNNLQIISSLINLKNNSSIGANAQNVLMDIHAKITSMALVHEKTYLQDTVGHIKVKEYLQSLFSELHNLLDSQSVPSFTVSGVDLEIPLELCINLGLVLTELLINSFKHAFPEQYNHRKKTIDLTISKKGKSYIFAIRDNGCGFDTNQKGTGIGLTVTQAIITDQLEGNLDIESRIGKGSTFRFTIPVSQFY